MPVLKASLGEWEVPSLHYFKDRGLHPKGMKNPIIDINSKIATIGSCFAENAVKDLSHRGLDITMHPTGLWYNTFSILQEFQEIFNQNNNYKNEQCLNEGNNKWIHPFRNYKKSFNTEKELWIWNDEINEIARSLYVNADVIIITLGLTEVWFSASTGNAYNQLIPPNSYKKVNPIFRQTDFNENYKNLKKIVDLLLKFTKAKIVFTVSPVPLYCTFSNLDVRVANSISKSTLRTSVAETIDYSKNIFYFHSYEIATSMDDPISIMEDDSRHVTDNGISLIMDSFLDTFYSGNFIRQSNKSEFIRSKRYKYAKNTLRNKLSKIFRKPL